ncbi:pseudouridylate synthase 1 homolog [Centruroides vittatus]|uniref:pseudouridylate synthase 1 homolog n=1 Tax=Centruroides vittatus TaxID=120091 RepID=UPI00351019F2
MIYRKFNLQTFASNQLQYIFSIINKKARAVGTKSCMDPLGDQDEAMCRGEYTTSDEDSDNHSVMKNKMSKYAIMFSYLGRGYYGIQRSPVVPTIEEELLKAMYKAGIIPKQHYLKPYNMWYQKASRTDKGVSALRQIVSLFLEKEIDTKSVIEKINTELCAQIKVMGIKKAIKTFDAKNNCYARSYSYTMPTLAFCPVEELCTENYRLSRKILEKVNDILKKFEGVHNYQNFTSSREAREKGCVRNIMSCECGQPFLYKGVEFVVIRIKGQSFMLHQIRNMIGLAIAIVRGLADLKMLRRNFTAEKIKYPMAPGLGLVLEEVHYNTYNWKYGGKGIVEQLSWEECQNEVHRFKTNLIQPDILETEISEKSMMKWLEDCFYYSYEAADKKPSDGKLYAAIAHLKRLRKIEETDKRLLDAVPNR